MSLGLRGRVDCWEAIGEARREFNEELRKQIRDYLKDNSDKLQDSTAYVGWSLFMIGPSMQRTKPTVMFVSDDKAARREAFRLIKDSTVMKSYPGFELGHMPLSLEFENLQPLGGSAQDKEKGGESAASHSAIYLSDVFARDVAGSTERWVYLDPYARFVDHSAGQSPRRSATVGVAASFGDKTLLLTVDHIFDTKNGVNNSYSQRIPDPEDGDDDCEITGLDSHGGGDAGDDLIDITSRGSMTPQSDVSDSADRDCDNGASIFSSGSTIDMTDHAAAVQTRLEALQIHQDTEPAPRGPFHPLIPQLGLSQPLHLGKIAMSSPALDCAFIEAPDEALSSHGLDATRIRTSAISLQDFERHTEPEPRDAAVTTITRTGQLIWGTLSGTPTEVRLPHGRDFREVWTARMSSPLSLGDCGAVVRDAVSGRIFGHVIAGSTTSGLVMVVPAREAFSFALEELSSRAASVPTQGDDIPVLEVLPSETMFMPDGTTIVVDCLPRERAVSRWSNQREEPPIRLADDRNDLWKPLRVTPRGK